MTRISLNEIERRFLRPRDILEPAASGAYLSGISSDSRRAAGPKTGFAALSGAKAHGAVYARELLARGCPAVFIETPCPAELIRSVRLAARKRFAAVYAAPELRKRLGQLAALVYGNPLAGLKVVAVTGTSGKTTTCYLLEAIAASAGWKSGVLGTVSNRIGKREFSASLTTPQPDETLALAAAMVAEGCRVCFMEATSQALDLGRLEGFSLDGAAFLNLSRDHLDYHRTMARYFKSKAGLFFRILSDSPKAFRFSAVNLDDSWGRKLFGRLGERVELRPVGFGFGERAFVSAQDVRIGPGGTRFILKAGRSRAPVSLSLIGRHNVSNALAAAALGLRLGLEPQIVARGLGRLRSVPGRLERVPSRRGITVLVDYAHKPDALQNVLSTLRALPALGRLIVVTGCGGDRDPGKRPLTGRIAVEEADYAVFTSDNPRTENPEAILDAIESGARSTGLSNYRRITDRRQAIEWAICRARIGDCVLVAGKGHENYQIFRDRTIPFDDREVCREARRKS